MNAPVQIAPTAPKEWAERISVLARPLRGRYQGSRHALSLGLSGELLERGVNPNTVPAIMQGVAIMAGWGDPAHHWKNSEATVHRWAEGRSVRRDVPPELVPVLDHVTSTTTQAPPPLPETQRRLYHAIADAPNGASVVRAPCGLGKTWTAENIAEERSQREQKTIVSLPTNALSRQVTAHLRDRGLEVLRVFGPLSVEGKHACQYRAAAAHLANGGQSVRYALCETCDFEAKCEATVGSEGPTDAKIVIGNHGLLGELDRTAGKQGLFVVDEPPTVLDDVTFDHLDLMTAREMIDRFEPECARALAPGLAVARAWLHLAPLDEPHRLALVPVDVDDDLLEDAEALDIVEAADKALTKRQHAPPIQRRWAGPSRTNVEMAKRLGLASRVLLAIHRALTQDDVMVTVYEVHDTQERKIAFTGVEPHLYKVLRRDGRVVVTAADAHLYRSHYQSVLGYEPGYTELSAADGVAVRRVHLYTKAASRARWVRQKRPPTALLHQALAIAREAGPQVAIVTFKALESWAREQAPGLDVGHYGALRGLDHWKDHDAIITLGDPIINLHHVARTLPDGEELAARAEALARAELEQAHGRLRVVHRKTPCTQLHVGRLVPLGWREPVELHHPPRGRPPRPQVSVVWLRQVAQTLGGVSATARRLSVSRSTFNRWLGGGCVPPPEVVDQLRAAGRQAKPLKSCNQGCPTIGITEAR